MLSKIYPLTAYTNILLTLNVKFKMPKRKKQKYYSILRTIFSNWNILFGLELTTCLSNVSQNPLVLNGDYPVKSLERLPPSSSKNPTARPCATGDRIFPTYLVFRPPDSELHRLEFHQYAPEWIFQSFPFVQGTTWESGA